MLSPPTNGLKIATTKIDDSTVCVSTAAAQSIPPPQRPHSRVVTYDRGDIHVTKLTMAVTRSVTVIWCISMVLLFFDIFLVKRAFPALFEEVRSSHPAVLYVSGIVGMGASAFGAYVTFKSPWTPLFSTGDWRLWLGVLVGVSALAAIAIYAISQFTHRGRMPEPATREPTATPAM